MTAVVQTYIDAWNRRDAQAIVDAFANGGTYQDPATPGPLSGAAIGEYAQGLWAAFPDLRFTVEGPVHEAPGHVSFRWLMLGTNHGSFQGLPPTQKSVSVPGCDFVELAGDKIMRLQGFFDPRSVPLQLGLDILVQPKQIGPFQFGTSVAVSADKTVVPGAFSITQLHISDPAQSEENRMLGRSVMAEMLSMKGFIGATTMAIGERRITVSAWEHPDDPKQLMRDGTHVDAMKRFWSHLGTGGYTSVWKPERINPHWLRCTACGKMGLTDHKNCKACGADMPAAPTYW